MKEINRTKRKDRELKVVVRDLLNWAIVPIDANMDNPKSKWSKVVSNREYLLDVLQMVDLPIETVQRYNESREVFSIALPYLLEQDKNGEYHIKLLAEDGSKKFIYSHRDKERLISKHFEKELKSLVINHLSIDNALIKLSHIGE